MHAYVHVGVCRHACSSATVLSEVPVSHITVRCQSFYCELHHRLDWHDKPLPEPQLLELVAVMILITVYVNS
jgi:hypothetical protein